MSSNEFMIALFYLLFAFLPGIVTVRHFKNSFFIGTATSLTLTLVLFTFIARLDIPNTVSYALSILATSLIFELSLKIIQKKRTPNTPLFEFQGTSKLNDRALVLFFLLLFFCLLAMRSQFSQIYFDPNRLGGEKLFNLQFLNSFAHGHGYPPESLWFADTTVGYYLLPKVLPGVFLNLVAFLYPPSHFLGPIYHISDCFWVAFASTVLAQLVTAIFCTKTTKLTFLCSALAGLFPLFTGPLKAIEQAYGTAGSIDLWSLSRVIDNTVNEYPFWNFIWADNHSHSNVLVFQMTFFFWLVYFLRSGMTNPQSRHYPSLIMCAFAASSVSMSHSGSVLIDVFLSAAIGLFFFIWHLKNKSGSEFLNMLSGLILCTLVLFLPDYLARPQASVKWYFVPAFLRSTSTELTQIYFAHLLLALILLIVFLVFKPQKEILNFKKSTQYPLILGSFFCLILLILVPEFLAVNWDMGEKYMRYNTLFRFLFESYYWFPLLTVGPIVFFASQSKIQNRVLIFCLTVTGGFFIFFSVAQTKTFWVRSESPDQVTKGLDGLKWFQKEHPNDWAIVEYLDSLKNQNIVIAEECGMPPKPSSYSSFGRIAALSGRPTLCGWGQHVFLFQRPSQIQNSLLNAGEPRKNTWEQLLAREVWLKKLYSKSLLDKETLNFMKALKLTHLVFGELEKRESPELDLKSLESRGTIVFKKEGYGVIELTSYTVQN